MQRTAICMRFTEAANVAHRSINRVLPQTKIVYNGQTYRGYMNSRDITIQRQEGGYCNQRDRIIHIQTGDAFQIGGRVGCEGMKFKITAVTSNCVYKVLTLSADLYE